MVQVHAADALVFIGSPVEALGFGAHDAGIYGVVKGDLALVQLRGLAGLAHPHGPQGEGGALQQAEHAAHALLFPRAPVAVLAQETQAHKAGGGAPVPGQALGAAAREALLLPISVILHGVVVQVPQPRVVEQIQPVPGVAGAVGHDPHGLAVDVKALPVGLHHHVLPVGVGEGPVQGGHCAQQRDGAQGALLLQHPGGLLHRGALGQHVVDQHGGLDGQLSFLGLLGIVGKAPEVELSAHEPRLVDPLVDEGGGGTEQKTRAHGGIAGLALRFGQLAALHGAAAEVVLGPRGHIGHRRSGGQTVKIQIAAPQGVPLPGAPAQGAAARRHGGHGCILFHMLRSSPAGVSGPGGCEDRIPPFAGKISIKV